MPRSFLVASCLLAAAAAALLVGPADAFFFSRMPARLQQVQTQGPASRLALFGYVHGRERKGGERRGGGTRAVAASSTVFYPFAHTHMPHRNKLSLPSVASKGKSLLLVPRKAASLSADGDPSSSLKNDGT